jgi:hypothetical protein
MLEWFMAISTAAIAIFAFATWRAYRQIEWYTGSMDSYSSVMLRLKVLELNQNLADAQKIQLIWWDKTLKSTPTMPGHGKPVETTKLYLMLPLDLRQGRSSLCRDINQHIAAFWKYLTAPSKWPVDSE